MTIPVTTGYLIQRIRRAKADASDTEQSRAHEYYAKFRALESHFFVHVHPLVDVGLAVARDKELSDGEHPDIMTIHGCRHVADLVESLDQIAQGIDRRQGATPINATEAYLLLCAAHLHDAGNIGGRKDHPRRSGELIKEHHALFYDTETRHNVFDIARVHGGVSGKYGKDTFRELGGDSFTSPRIQLLASILRIGDELSENPERVPGPLLDWFKASTTSNFAYRYAQCFRRFSFENDKLDIHLRIFPEQHQYAPVVNGKTMDFFVHLEKKIDVIEKEVRYCSQYGRPHFDVRTLRFTVEYYAECFPSVVTNTSTLTLDLGYGYPGCLPPLADRCSDLRAGVSLASYCRGPS